MGVAIVDAVRLARTNKDRHAALQGRHEQLVAELDAEATAGAVARVDAHAALERFAAAFRRLRHADLADLADLVSVDQVQADALPSVELRALRVNALGGLTALAGGAAAGGTAGALTFSAVGVLATASTGTAISTLSGAAATSATLAWLGVGSLAAGGGGVAAGTTVMTGIVALPVVVTLAAVVEWQGRRLRRGQRETAAQITAAEAEFLGAEAVVLALSSRARRVRHVVDDLRDELDRLLPEMLRSWRSAPTTAAGTPPSGVSWPPSRRSRSRRRRSWPRRSLTPTARPPPCPSPPWSPRGRRCWSAPR